MPRNRKDRLMEEHARRQYRILPTTLTTANWSDVPDDVILNLVRSYSDSGDAILFGKSTDQSVLAIRVYRQGQGYSVYSRGIERLGEAVERLERYRPPRTKRDAIASAGKPAVQGYTNLNLPFHPAFSPEQLEKQRLDAINRAIRWNAMVDAIPREFYRVASG